MRPQEKNESRCGNSDRRLNQSNANFELDRPSFIEGAKVSISAGGDIN
jgi:hypothetical protein